MSKPSYDELRAALDKMQNLFTPDATKDCILEARALMARLRACVGCEHSKCEGSGVIRCRWANAGGRASPEWCSTNAAVNDDYAEHCPAYIERGSAVDNRPTAPMGYNFKQKEPGTISVYRGKFWVIDMSEDDDTVAGQLLYEWADAAMS